MELELLLMNLYSPLSICPTLCRSVPPAQLYTWNWPRLLVGLGGQAERPADWLQVWPVWPQSPHCWRSPHFRPHRPEWRTTPVKVQLLPPPSGQSQGSTQVCTYWLAVSVWNIELQTREWRHSTVVQSKDTSNNVIVQATLINKPPYQ